MKNLEIRSRIHPDDVRAFMEPRIKLREHIKKSIADIEATLAESVDLREVIQNWQNNLVRGFPKGVPKDQTLLIVIDASNLNKYIMNNDENALSEIKNQGIRAFAERLKVFRK